MPAHLERDQWQSSTEQANDSRLITKIRWAFEARNGHIKSIFNFLDKIIQIQYVSILGDFYKIAAAFINRYHPLLQVEGADAALAHQFLAKAQEPNIVQALVEVENLHTRNSERWVSLSANQLNDFPILDLDYLKYITTGTYQLGLAPSYIQYKLQRDGDNDDEFQLDMLRNEDRIPIPDLMRARVYSRHRGLTKYQLWISYKPAPEDNDNEPDDIQPLINGHYCLCKSRAKTLGTCAHVACILWFFGYARHKVNVQYPSTNLIETVMDAGNRPVQKRN